MSDSDYTPLYTSKIAFKIMKIIIFDCSRVSMTRGFLGLLIMIIMIQFASPTLSICNRYSTSILKIIVTYQIKNEAKFNFFSNFSNFFLFSNYRLYFKKKKHKEYSTI